MSGTPWYNFKSFLIKTKDEYEELAKTGTDELDEEMNKFKCTICKKNNHSEENCRFKKQQLKKGDEKKTCYLCGVEGHIAKNCSEKSRQGPNGTVSKKKIKGKNGIDQDCHSNYFRVKDCKWCARACNSPFKCSGCGKQWGFKVKCEHCLAHCAVYSSASVKERGDMVLRVGNCLICLHHEHYTDSCFGKDQQKTPATKDTILPTYGTSACDSGL